MQWLMVFTTWLIQGAVYLTLIRGFDLTENPIVFVIVTVVLALTTILMVLKTLTAVWRWSLNHPDFFGKWGRVIGRSGNFRA